MTALPNGRREWLPAVVVAAVTLAVFAPALHGQFLAWDDAGFIRDNPRLRPATWANVAYFWTTVGERTPGQLYTPTAYTAWSALAAVFGVTPVPFHAVNVLLHAATAVVAFDLLRRLFNRPWAAAAGAVLFAVHPVQVESVAWASETKDLLCGLFSAAALWAYVAAAGGRADPGRRSTSDAGLERATTTSPVGRTRCRLLYAVATLLFVLALASKPTAIVVPFMAAAIDRLLLRRPWPIVVRWLWPWVVLAVPCGLVARAAQPVPWAAPVAAWTRPLVATDAIAFYVGKVVWPLHLGVDYGRRPTAVVASGAIYWTWVVPAAVVALLAWRRSRAMAAGAVVFALPLVPVSGLVPFDFQFYSTTADHYLYLPMLGVAIGATAALSTAGARRWAAAGVVLLVLAGRSLAQVPVWRDDRTLFTHGLAVNPASFVSCDMLGHADAVDANATRGSRPTVAATDPAYAAWRAESERALDWYQRSLELFPGYVPSLVNEAIINERLGRPAAVRAALRRVANLQPTLPAAMKMDPLRLGRWMIDSGDPAGAAAFLAGVVRADPNDVAALLMMAEAQQRAPAGRPGLR